MTFNKNTGDQETVLIKKNLRDLNSAAADFAESIQWLLDNGVTVAEDGSVTFGDVKFTKTELQTLKELAQ